MTKQLLSFTGLFAALAVVAAPEGYVTKSASSDELATVYFEPGNTPGLLQVVDVTSDKESSVLSWSVGAGQVTLRVDAADDATVLYTSLGTIAENDLLVSVTDAGVVTPHVAGTNSLATNALVTLHNPIGTNVVAGDGVRELSGVSYTISSTSSTNIAVVSTNSPVATNTVYLLAGNPWQRETNTVASFTTNGTTYVLTFDNPFGFTPLHLLTLTTNEYSAAFAAEETSTQLVLDHSTGLASADQVVVLPATGGGFVRQISTTAEYVTQVQELAEATGLALAAGDRLFVLDTALTTPVGAASLRIFADLIRVQPVNVPAVLSIDGTSACSINAATISYGP